MRGVSIVVVGQLRVGVQEAAVPGEVAGRGGGVGGRRRLALAPAGKGVELGVADVGQPGGRSGVIAGLGTAGRGKGARTRGSSARCGPRAAGTAADGRGAPWCSCRGAVVRVVHSGAGRGAAFVVSRGSDVVVAISRVLGINKILYVKIQ